jgi:TolB-like protein
MSRFVVLSPWVVLVVTSMALAAPDKTAELKAVLQGALPAVLGCYEPRLKEEPALEGRLVVGIALGKEGEVKEVTVAEDRLGDTVVAACVVAALRDLRFPGSAANLQVTYPFVFAPTRTLAVLPFDNLSGDKSLEWLRAGSAESLVTKLGQMSKLVLVDRLKLDSVLSEQALGQSGAVDPASAAAAGKLVGAQLLVTGSFQKAGAKVRLNARVVDTQSGRVRQAVEATGKLDDVFMLQDDLAAKLVEVMNIPPSSERDACLALKAANSMTVLKLLGQASNALHGVGQPRDKAAAAALYRQAIAADPKVPEAHLGLALALWVPSGDSGESVEVEAALSKALELRPNYHEAMTWLAFSLWRAGKYDEAMALDLRALALKPDYALGTYGLCISLASKGKGVEALALCQRAMDLDPRNAEYRTQTGQLVALYQRDHAAARKLTRVAVEAGEDHEWFYTTDAYVSLMAGDTAACLATLAAGRKVRKPTDSRNHLLWSQGMEVACRAKGGDAPGARAALEAVQDPQWKAVFRGEAPAPAELPAFVKDMLAEVAATSAPVAKQAPAPAKATKKR